MAIPSFPPRSLRPLPNEFKNGGFIFRIVQRSGQIVLLEKTKPGWTRKHFEVVRIVPQPAKIIGRNSYPAREAMPPSSSWGKMGWSYLKIEDAQSKFKELAGQQKQPVLSTPPTQALVLEAGRVNTAKME